MLQYYFSLLQFWQIKCSLFIHSTMPYVYIQGLILELSQYFPIAFSLCLVKISLEFPCEMPKGYSRKKYLGGEEGKRYIFLWVVGADIFQIIWVIGV